MNDNNNANVTPVAPTTDAPAPEKKSNVSGKERKIYTYKKSPLICFAGAHYGPSEASAFDLESPVTKVEGAKGDATVLVTQKVKGKKAVTETWNLHTGDKAAEA